MRRRDFIAGVGGAVVWPIVGRGQQAERVRRVGVLMPFNENDSEPKAYLSALMQGLAELGRSDGRNLRIDLRWAGGNVDRMRVFAKELVDLQPDVILSPTTPVTAAFRRETRTIPIVFASVSDPVGDGFIVSLPRPGGNLTGFINMEASMGGKWLQLLMEIAPSLTRVAMMFNPDTSGGTYYLTSFETSAQSLKIDSVAAPVHVDAEIETTMTSLGREPARGLVVMGDSFTFVHRAKIISLAAQHNVPAIYPASVFARDGGLLSYGPDRVDIFRRSASYIDRILRGEKPADLPVQLPIKFEMALNAKTAKALGVAVPPSILLCADEVIE